MPATTIPVPDEPTAVAVSTAPQTPQGAHLPPQRDQDDSDVQEGQVPNYPTDITIAKSENHPGEPKSTDDRIRAPDEQATALLEHSPTLYMKRKDKKHDQPRIKRPELAYQAWY
ncbi:hypothetical protein NPX13_g4650 [Xylaria arbuscula]|uniref:Uncharacterized protein n=1 Tax=Xylaria arbuscula TaxID=114810 RepID=A0A9W8TNX2_9PEZI|nr:hypothetical protein NPX13_g4650 [Xylaria arbuscula]